MRVFVVLVLCLVSTGSARGVVMHVGWSMLLSVLVSMLLVLVCVVVTRVVVACVVMTVAAGLGGRGNRTVMAVLVGCCASARQVVAVLACPCRLDCLGCCKSERSGVARNCWIPLFGSRTVHGLEKCGAA